MSAKSAGWVIALLASIAIAVLLATKASYSAAAVFCAVVSLFVAFVSRRQSSPPGESSDRQ